LEARAVLPKIGSTALATDVYPPVAAGENAARLNLEPTNNIYLPGGRRVRGFLGIEALVHPCPWKNEFLQNHAYGLYACTLYGEALQFYGFTHYFIICVRRTLRTALFSPYAIF
jgi:hypothetical protein